ncbi:MAG TPA: DUF72 domain-containing protein [Vicinamibacterales bacterium]|nr:DUF72 domain-containing protein [Vicinamibacterales bacterium]
MSSLHIGCSGWQYKHWRDNFYPHSLRASQWLEYYASRFDTVEINNSFYRLPAADTFENWRRRVPSGFVYSVKASRYLTHMKKLKDPGPPLDLFFSRAKHLGNRLGPVLYQLPPRWPRNVERLDAFLRALPRRRRHVIEFREPSWYSDDVMECLRARSVALCLHDMAGSAAPRIVVGPFVYVRLHGPERYAGGYSREALSEWAEWCAARLAEGVPVYVYFNNDSGGHAPRDALRLRSMVNLLRRR